MDLREQFMQFQSEFSRLVMDRSANPLINKNLPSLPDGISDRFKRLIEYTIGQGKCFRSILFLRIFEHLREYNSKLKDEKYISQPLKRWILAIAWSIEVIQAALLIADDLMDQSSLRRNKPCWHLVCGDNPLAAVNDAFYLIFLIFCLFDKLKIEEGVEAGFNDHVYIQIVRLFHEMLYFTTVGQAMDMDSFKFNEKSFTEVNHLLDTYKRICEYKTTFYTITFPVKAAIIAVSTETPIFSIAFEKFTCDIGRLFQMMDDMKDWVGGSSGKTHGVDIREGKLTWPLISVISSKLDFEDRQKLIQNYGKENETSVGIVIGLYEKNEILKKFHSEVKSLCRNVKLVVSKELPLEFDKIARMILFELTNMGQKDGIISDLSLVDLYNGE